MDNKIYHIASKLYSGKKLNEVELAQLETIRADDALYELFEELNFVLKSSERTPLDQPIDLDQEWEDFKVSIQKVGSKQKVKTLYVWSSAAAVIAILFSLLFLLSNPSKEILYATQAEVEHFILPDQSEITLNKYSELLVHKNFNGKNRIVQLQGEGFFKVSKNAELPFEVRLDNGTQVQVLGTQFYLRSYKSDLITDLQVVSGKVAFGYQKKEPNLIVEKGNKAQFNTSKNQFSEVEPLNKHIGTWQTGEFEFDNTPLTDIAESFERYFNKDIVYPESSKGLNYSGRFNKPQEQDFAKIIAMAFGWNYQITESQIVFVVK